MSIVGHDMHQHGGSPFGGRLAIIATRSGPQRDEPSRRPHPCTEPAVPPAGQQIRKRWPNRAPAGQPDSEALAEPCTGSVPWRPAVWDTKRGDAGDTMGSMIVRRDFLRFGRAALAWSVIVNAGRAGADSLAELEQRTREYQDSLARLLDLQEQAVARATATAVRFRTLRAEGLVARRDLESAEQALADAQSRVDETRKRLADSEQIVTEAQARQRLATLPTLSPGEERATPEVIEHGGARPWTLAQVASLGSVLRRAVSTVASRERPGPDAAARSAWLRPPERRGHRGASGQRRGPCPAGPPPRAEHPLPGVPRAARGRVHRGPRARRPPVSPNRLGNSSPFRPPGDASDAQRCCGRHDVAVTSGCPIEFSVTAPLLTGRRPCRLIGPA